MNSVKNVKDCYGCGLCATVCKRKVVTIAYNSSGFLEPTVDEEACTDCGMCRDVCAFLHAERSVENKPIVSYGAWSNDDVIRKECSSGGVGYEIARLLLEQGFKVCACRYNAEKGQAEHYVATSINELNESKGSKYIQSYTIDGFKIVNLNEKYLIVGTPCQIDSFRRYVRKFKAEDNFVFVDFYCHGVPSHLAWVKYQELYDDKIGVVKEASWRNKETGWHDSWLMHLKGEKGEHFGWFSRGDLFYNLFLHDFCTNPACQKNCKYKYKSSAADIRIGDAWGSYYKSDTNGTSSVTVFTKKGLDVMRSLKSVTLEDLPFEVTAELQMKENARTAWLAPVTWRMLKSKKQYPLVIWNMIVKIEILSKFPMRVIGKLSRVIKRK